MKDRLGYNLTQTFVTSDGVKEVTHPDILSSAHIQLWRKEHPDMVGWDHDFFPKFIERCALEKDASYKEGFHRALEFVKLGLIDIDKIK